ncbi:hypothetical protein KDY119_00101 [Luteimicrobium xylanilyticum]|uniref:DUF4396 domain-containing protein n=2 Tax=Luteimicrobium xylanilyticum TaxID=1133546 RepID=A0A5P9Q5G1_9MICO|nr:hypothetical protein KDY119_00101 [Luteimicrobium xylanilyticum]
MRAHPAPRTLGPMLSTADFPSWTTPVCWALLALAGVCAAWVAVDVARRPQHMWIMNVVWPVVMLFGSVVWLGFYRRFARAAPRDAGAGHEHHADEGGDAATHDDGDESRAAFRVSVAVDTNHCGAGCSLGDVVGDGLLAVAPAVATAVGLGSLYHLEVFAGWIVGTVLAFVFGVVFQYFAIAPMRHLGVGRGLVEAVKADAASIAAWQVGMVGLMALVQLVWLPAWLGGHAPPSTPQYWVCMQVAMVVGYACSYPVNWWLVRAGIKTGM